MCMCGAPTGNTKSKGSVEKDSKKTKEQTKKGVYLSPCVIYFALIFHTVWRKLCLLKMHSHFEILPLSKIKGEQLFFSVLALCYSKEKICVQHFPHFHFCLCRPRRTDTAPQTRDCRPAFTAWRCWGSQAAEQQGGRQETQNTERQWSHQGSARECLERLMRLRSCVLGCGRPPGDWHVYNCNIARLVCTKLDLLGAGRELKWIWNMNVNWSVNSLGVH